MSERHIRFAVRSEDGATTDIWKCWTSDGTGKRDVYLTSRPLGHALKLSLHEEGRWHVGFHSQKRDQLFSPEALPASRFLGTWDRPNALSAPWVLAARVCFPWSSPSKPPRDAPETTRWLECAPQGEMVEVAVFLVNATIARDDWPGKDAMKAGLVGRMPLDGGGEVVIVFRNAEMSVESQPKSGTTNYFRGKSKAGLVEANRIVAWGESPDGSITFLESRAVVQRGGAA
jgi:hypothetical protein